jgi:hypothetical protein
MPFEMQKKLINRRVTHTEGWIVKAKKFIAGIIILACIISIFASGFTPPGACGEVIRHNQQADIDATPLFYTEVENISELIEGVERLGHKDN